MSTVKLIQTGLKSGPGTTPGVGLRKLNGWIESFVEHTSVLPTPVIIRRWTAISAVAAALERRVWVRTAGSDLFPNLYVLLVAAPGIGKGLAIVEARKLFNACLDKEIVLAPNSVSKASLMDTLAEARRRTVGPGLTAMDFNALYVVSTELGVLIPAWDSEFMNSLTDVYDGGPYEERKRTSKTHIQISRPVLNLLGGTTPSYLADVMPPGAWDQGFISRTILIYSGERNLIDIFDSAGVTTSTDLQEDLKAISKLQGKLTWEPEAAALLKEWHLAGGPPTPTHPKLEHYNTRRTAHAIKLCMISSASRGGSMVITQFDVGTAIGWLVEAEAGMPDIFLAQTAGGDSRAMDDTAAFLWQEYARNKTQPVPEYVLVEFLKRKVPSHNIMKVIDVMLRSRMMQLVAGKDGAAYKPSPRIPL